MTSNTKCIYCECAIFIFTGFKCLHAPVFVCLLSLCQLCKSKKHSYPFLSLGPRSHMIN